MLENGLAYQILFCITLGRALFPGSSAVEQATVNRLAGGSNPSRGAIIFQINHFLRQISLEVDRLPLLTYSLDPGKSVIDILKLL